MQASGIIIWGNITRRQGLTRNANAGISRAKGHGKSEVWFSDWATYTVMRRHLRCLDVFTEPCVAHPLCGHAKCEGSSRHWIVTEPPSWSTLISVYCSAQAPFHMVYDFLHQCHFELLFYSQYCLLIGLFRIVLFQQLHLIICFIPRWHLRIFLCNVPSATL